MDTSKLNIAVNKSLEIDIKNHLEKCNSLFKPPLDSYIDLVIYSKKLYEYANRYEVFYDGFLIGLVAVYFSSNKGFISNFSLEKEWIGRGVSDMLMKVSIDDFKKKNIEQIRLEVFKENSRALNFYYRYGFVVEYESLQKLTLIKTL